MNEFYKSILNINNKDRSEEIQKIVKEEVSKLQLETPDLTGFCKYISYALYDRLKEININSNIIDLSELVSVDHVILITDTEPRILIDPTFSQFTKTEDKILVGLDFWPSEKIEKQILNDLLNQGCIKLNQEKFQNYMKSFTADEINFDLEEIILDNKLNSKKI